MRLISKKGNQKGMNEHQLNKHPLVGIRLSSIERVSDNKYHDR